MASFFLLNTLASEFRLDMSRLSVSQKVLDSLTGEEVLAATLIQMAWQKRTARILGAERALKIAEAAAIESKRARGGKRRMRIERRLAAETHVRAAARAEGRPYVGKSAEERAAEQLEDELAEEADAEEAARLHEQEVARGHSSTDAFEAQRATLLRFRHCHLIQQWDNLKRDALRACAAKLRVWVGLARGLMNADKHGLSDPYVIVSLGKQSQRTSIIQDCVDPNWNEYFDFALPPEWVASLRDTVDYEELPLILTFRLFDFDVVGSHDPIGHCTLRLSRADLLTEAEFRSLPVMINAEEQKGVLHVAFSFDEGLHELPKEVVCSPLGTSFYHDNI